MSIFYRVFSYICAIAAFFILSQLHAVAIAQQSALTAEQLKKLEETREYQGAAIKLNSLGLAGDARVVAERVLETRKSLAGNSSIEVADSLSDLGLICREQGDYKAARTYLDQALAIDEKLRGREHPATATVLERLGILLELQSEIPKARQSIERAVSIRRKVLGAEHPETLSAMIFLGEMKRLQAEMSSARATSEQALALCRKVLGEEHRDTARAYSALGDYFGLCADVQSAKPNYEKALAIRRKVLGEQHPETAASLARWAMVLIDEGKDDEIQSLLKKAYEIDRQMRGEDHAETAAMLSAQGQYELAKADYATSIQTLAKVLVVYKARLGEEHHDTASCLRNLGIAYLQQGDVDASSRHIEQSLKIYRKVWGAEHPDTASVLNVMGNIAFYRGDFDTARTLFTQALNTDSNFFGKESDFAALGHFYLGMAARAQKDFKTARDHYEMALAIYAKNQGEESTSSISARRELGGILFEMQEYEAARQQFEQLLALRKKVLGPKHSDTIEAANSLGVVLYSQSKFVEARKVYDEALAVQSSMPDGDKLGIAQTQYNIGILLQAQEDMANARQYLEWSLATRAKLLGEQHEDTKKSQTALQSLGALPVQPAPPKPAPSKPVAPPAMPNSPRSGLPNNSSSVAESDLITPQDVARLSPAQIAKLQSVVPQLEKAMALYQKGQFREFLPVAEKLSLEINGIFGPVHKMSVLALAMRGSAHNSLAEYEIAQPLLEKSLALQIQLVGEQNAQTANIITELASFHSARGNHSKAREYAERSLAIQRNLQGENHSDTALAICKLGMVILAAQDYDTARVHLEKALSILKQNDQPNSPNRETTALSIAEVITGLALIQHLAGDVLKARENYEQTLAIRRRVLGEQHPATALSYMQMGLMQFSLGDMPLSKQSFEKSLSIHKNAYGENHPNVAEAHVLIGEVCLAQKNFADARLHMERASSIRQQLLGESHPDYASSLLCLGKVELELDKFATARGYFDRAYAIYQKQFGEDGYANVTPINSLSELLLRQGKYTEARQYAEKMVRLMKPSVAKDSFDMAAALRSLSEANAGANAWDEAILHMDSARRLVRRLASDVLPGLSERELLQCLRTADEDFWHVALSMGLVKREDQAIVDYSASWLVNGKGIAQESLAIQQATRLAKQEGRALVDQAISGKWVELDSVRKSLPTDTTLLDFAKIRIRNFASKSREEQWGEARYLVWIIQPEGKDAVRVVDLGDAESIDALVVEFNKAMKASMRSGKSKGTIEELGEVDATGLIDKPTRALANRLLEPLRADLAKSKNVVLSPDASLWLVPWATLPVADDKYWIEEVSLQLVVSSRDLVRTPPADVRLTQPVIMADPSFDLNSQQIQTATQAVLRSNYKPATPSGLRSATIIDALPRVNRLPYTAVEAQAILPDLESITKDKSLMYVGEFALEGVFKKVRQPKMLVLSTHGVFLPNKDRPVHASESLASISKQPQAALVGPTDNPLLRCGLLLAGCNQRPVSQTDDDGVLTGDEIMACNLRGTELVVLSACETGVGEVRNGDGVAGLRQAFQLAGAKSVVATLWVIDDRESAYFMRDFFKHLQSGKSQADAMRSAQLERIETRRNRYGAAHPFYWAAWTLTGGVESSRTVR